MFRRFHFKNWLFQKEKQSFKPAEKEGIPRRQLTVESTQRLSNIVDRILIEMLEESCPCQYPRFRFLARFSHFKYNARAVFCADTNYFVGAATFRKNFLKRIDTITENYFGDFGGDWIYQCKKCGTKYRHIHIQYSLMFEFVYLVVVEPKYFFFNVGAELKFPVPLLQGLYGFDEEDILKCASEFTLGDEEQVYNYFTEKVQNVVPKVNFSESLLLFSIYSNLRKPLVKLSLEYAPCGDLKWQKISEPVPVKASVRSENLPP